MHPIDECYKKVKNECFKFINLQETKKNKFKNKNNMLKSYLIPLSFWIKKKLKKNLQSLLVCLEVKEQEKLQSIQ